VLDRLRRSSARHGGVASATFTPMATVIFGALLVRVADPYSLMAALRLLYPFAIILSALCGVTGLMAGLALSNTRRSKPPNRQSPSVDKRELREAAAHRGTGEDCQHGSFDPTSSFPDAHGNESASVSKTTPAPVGAEPDAEQRS
jgi:hypothetical protein